MTWTVPIPSVDEKGVGTIAAVYNQGDVDEFKVSISVNLAEVSDLTAYADKFKALQVEFEANRVKPNKYAEAITALEAALNGGK